MSSESHSLYKKDFNDFYNALYDLEEYKNSWVVDEEMEKTIQMREIKETKESEKLRNEMEKREQLKMRELDLRRKLLHRIGKYELEEGEVFE